jgi:hypothetical protein
MSNYFELQNAPVLTTPSALTAPKITSIGYPGDDTAADPAGGQTITLTGEGFEAGASVIINTAAVGVVSVVSNTTITFTSPALSTGSYPVYVVNTDGGTAIAVPGIQYSGTPTWTTAAGSLGSYTETQSISNTVTATGDAPISYSLFSGTLPTGATLNSANGLISGTSPLSASPTTYTFTIRATDAQQQDTNRQFSLTINPDVVTWSSPANGTTYTSTANSAISNVALSATAASGQSVSYTANALPTGLSLSGSNITGTPTVVANSSTLLTATAATTNATATRTINWVISVASDPDFEYVTTLLSASNPTSTFVTDASTNNFAVTVFGDTRPNNFGPYTPGYYSNFFDGTGDYLLLPTTSALAFPGDFTVEAWVYLNSVTGPQGVYTSIDNASDNWEGISLTFNGTSFLATSYIPTVDTITHQNTVTIGQWYHIAIVRNGSSTKSYLNGVQSNTTTLGTYSLTQSGGTIGAQYPGSGPLNGYISNLRVLKGTALYTSTFTPPTTPLTAIANTQLLTCQSNRFIDNSTNNFTITRFGDTSISGFDPFAPLSAYSGYGSGYFDGSGDYLTGSADISPRGTEDFTIEFWYYPTSLGSAERYFLVGSGNNGFIFGITNFGNDIAIIRDLTGAIVANFGSRTQLTLNAWNYVVVTRSSNVFRCYINGSPTTTPSVTDSYSFATPSTTTLLAGSFMGYCTDMRVTRGLARYTGASMSVPTVPLSSDVSTTLLTLQNNQPNNNNMFLDSSASNFLITRNGNTTQGSFSPYGGGWSNYFDGSGDYLTVADTANIQPGSGNCTWEAWIYPLSLPSAGNFKTLWAQRATDAGIGGAAIVFNSSGNYVYFIANSAANAWQVSGVSTGFNVLLNQWQHVALVRSGNTMTMYLNGVAGTTASVATGAIGTSGNLSLMAGAANGIQTVDGYMSNFRFVKGTAVYTANFTPPTAPLTPIANTNLLTCADNRFIDDSSNNFTITRNGDVSVQRFNPFNPVLTTPTSYSGYFDGTGDYLTIASATGLGVQSADFTLEVWAYFNAATATNDQPFYNNLTASGYVANTFWFGKHSATSGKVTVYIYNYSSSTYLMTEPSLPPANQWVHYALVRNGNTFTIYRNGVATVSSTFSGAVTGSTSPAWIGRSGDGADINSFNGYMSNLRLVNGTAVYTSAFTPPTSPLTAIANTSLLTLQNATFVDNSTNNFAITANGNSQPTQFNPFGWTSTTGSNAAYSVANYGGSMYFDGSGDFLSLAGNTAFTMPGNFTAEAWVYCNGYTNDYAAIFGFSSDSENTGWNILVRTNGRLHFNVAMTFTDATGTLPLNQWTHVALVRSGSGSGNVKLYVNGVADATTLTVTATATSPSTVMLGSYPGITSRAFNGYISNARIVKGTAVYTSNFAPPVAPLSFNANAVLQVNGTSAAIYDSSMMVNYETIGNTLSTGSIKKYGNSSIYIAAAAANVFTPASPNLDFGTGDFTIECFVYSVNSGIGLYPTFISSVTGWSSGASGHRFNNTGAANKFTFHLNGAGDPFLTSSGTYSFNTWYYYALTRSGNTWRMFIDGVQQASGSFSGSFNQALGGMRLGYAQWDGTNGYYNGYLDDLRFTKGVARYTSNFTPPTTPFMQN